MADAGPVNQTAGFVDSAIHAIVFDIALNAAKAELISLAPWLKLPVISQLFDLVMNAIAEPLYKNLAIAGIFGVIDAQVSSQNAAYIDSIAALQSSIASNDPQAINLAKEKARAALQALIHFDGSTTPR